MSGDAVQCECPKCKATFRAKRAILGRSATCPKCTQTIEVIAAATDRASIEEATATMATSETASPVATGEATQLYDPRHFEEWLVAHLKYLREESETNQRSRVHFGIALIVVGGGVFVLGIGNNQAWLQAFGGWMVVTGFSKFFP